jgi:hypothetical protein
MEKEKEVNSTFQCRVQLLFGMAGVARRALSLPLCLSLIFGYSGLMPLSSLDIHMNACLATACGMVNLPSPRVTTYHHPFLKSATEHPFLILSPLICSQDLHPIPLCS